MKRFYGEEIFAGLLLIFYFVVPIGVAVFYLGDGAIKHFSFQCVTKTIGYDKHEVQDPDAMEGTTYIDSPGVAGKKQVCTRSSDDAVHETVLVNPVSEVSHYGTKTLPDITPSTIYHDTYGANGATAECSDGSYSYSTGRGTCSWHGGVYEWLY